MICCYSLELHHFTDDLETAATHLRTAFELNPLDRDWLLATPWLYSPPFGASISARQSFAISCPSVDRHSAHEARLLHSQASRDLSNAGRSVSGSEFDFWATAKIDSTTL